MAGSVYVFGNEKLHWYKIGMSQDPECRFKDIAGGVPFKIEIIASFPVQKPRAMEKLLHERFAAKRSGHEWFKLTPDDLRDLFNVAGYESLMFQLRQEAREEQEEHDLEHNERYLAESFRREQAGLPDDPDAIEAAIDEQIAREMAEG